jgi:type II secretory pathway component PulF
MISYIQFWEESNSLWEKVEYLYRKDTEDLLNFYDWISKIIEPLLIIFLWVAIWYVVWWIMMWVMNLANTIR